MDTFTTINQNADLVEWVKSFGRNLAYIYSTHAHGDHLFGVGQVLEAFPNAVAIGSAETVADAPINDQPSWRQDFWEKLFPGQIPRTVYPQLLDGDHLELEGHRLEVIEMGRTDRIHSTSLADLDPVAVVAGHKNPDLGDDPGTIAQTAAYLRDFNRLEGETSSAEELYDRTLELYPRRANPGSLWGGAKAAKPEAIGVGRLH